MNIYIIGLALILGIILILVIDGFLHKRKSEKLGWRTSRSGRNEILYEQKVVGVWKGIELDGEPLHGKINLVIYFKKKDDWTDYPKWAQNRTEIIKRVQAKFPPNRTDYENA